MSLILLMRATLAAKPSKHQGLFARIWGSSTMKSGLPIVSGSDLSDAAQKIVKAVRGTK